MDYNTILVLQIHLLYDGWLSLIFLPLPVFNHFNYSKMCFEVFAAYFLYQLSNTNSIFCEFQLTLSGGNLKEPITKSLEFILSLRVTHLLHTAYRRYSPKAHFITLKITVRQSLVQPFSDSVDLVWYSPTSDSLNFLTLPSTPLMATAKEYLICLSWLLYLIMVTLSCCGYPILSWVLI